MIDAIVSILGSLMCFVLGALFGSMMKSAISFREGFKKGYHQGCKTAKKVVHLFENEKGDPAAQFFDGDKAVVSVAHVPPSAHWNE